MMNEIDVIRCEVATLTDVNLREAYALLPAVEKKCREIKKEVKERIEKNGQMEGLKAYEENAGVKITDMKGFYESVAMYIDKETFLSKCCTVNLTALKSIIVPVLQEKALTEGERINKGIINAMIDQKALEFGEQKTKQTII